MPIAVLAPDVAAKIAAGEVVERPASIVRELVDNAIDAGARRIQIEIEAGGTQLIRITDDGCGIPAEDLPTAFLRHATSKLLRAEDLAAVTTLGFRGEALPSIVAAADVDFASRPEGGGAGRRLRFRQGEPAVQTPYAGARGTVVEVTELFGRQPARRKFLRSTGAESGQVASLLGLYAMAYPEVAFALTVDGRRSLVTSGGGDRREAVGKIYGPQAAAALLELEPDSAAPGEPLVSGLISPPDLTRGNRSYITCFVNRRIVQPRRLVFAVESAYESFLLSGRHPIAVLDLRLPADEVDVNVHPTKSEVRFLRERDVHAAVYHRVRETLGRLSASAARAIPSWSPFRAQSSENSPAPGALPLWRVIGQVEPHDRSPSATPVPPVSPAVPILRVVGQAGSLYIVAEGPDGMYLIDQHAAHERVLYEKLLVQRSQRMLDVQGLLSPVSVELTPGQAATLDAHAGALSGLGFELEPFGPRTYLLRAIPNILADKDTGRTLTDLLDDLAEGAETPDRDSRATMTVACHAAVRAGKTLVMDEMRELLSQLEHCDLPRTCPHGRPTMIHLSSEALEREFRRR